DIQFQGGSEGGDQIGRRPRVHASTPAGERVFDADMRSAWNRPFPRSVRRAESAPMLSSGVRSGSLVYDANGFSAEARFPMTPTRSGIVLRMPMPSSAHPAPRR